MPWLPDLEGGGRNQAHLAAQPSEVEGLGSGQGNNPDKSDPPTMQNSL